MKKRIILIVAALIILISVLRFLVPNEKDRVKKDINSLKNAVEEEDKIAVLKYIDETYNDRGNVTYEGLINIINDFFEKTDSIKVLISNLKIKIDSTDIKKNIFASCSLGLKVLARHEGDRVIVFGGLIKPAAVCACLKKSGGHYKIYYAEY